MWKKRYSYNPVSVATCAAEFTKQKILKHFVFQSTGALNIQWKNNLKVLISINKINNLCQIVSTSKIVLLFSGFYCSQKLTSEISKRSWSTRFSRLVLTSMIWAERRFARKEDGWLDDCFEEWQLPPTLKNNLNLNLKTIRTLRKGRIFFQKKKKKNPFE